MNEQNKKTVNKSITPRSEDYSKWYLDIVEAADLAENSIVRGCIVIKPYGYAIWEQFQTYIDKKIKETGHKNVYFPIFIPKSLFNKEAEHVEGFAKESAVVTHHRLKTENGKIVVDEDAKLQEELIVRPTSEAIMYDTFSRWITSYRDLPLLLNQWGNVVRWELRTRPFLRTSEFLWQEGHTAHATEQEADEEALKMLEIYRVFIEDYLAISVITGTKTRSETFAGALRTYTLEPMMQDGKALQAGTSHNLGQNFAKAFNVQFSDRDNKSAYVWQTSWAVTTRLIGALIMSHSDDKGFIVPPRIAPIQVVIIPIFRDEESKKTVMEEVEKIKKELRDFRLEVDSRDYTTMGEKMYEWEKKGIPVRIEIGKRDIENNSVMIARRDTGEKQPVSRNEMSQKVTTLLEEIQHALFAKSKKFREENTHIVNSYEELKKQMEQNIPGYALAHWCGMAECENRIKEETKATARCIPFDTKEEEEGKCIVCGMKSDRRIIFAKAY